MHASNRLHLVHWSIDTASEKLLAIIRARERKSIQKDTQPVSLDQSYSQGTKANRDDVLVKQTYLSRAFTRSHSSEP